MQWDLQFSILHRGEEVKYIIVWFSQHFYCVIFQRNNLSLIFIWNTNLKHSVLLLNFPFYCVQRIYVLYKRIKYTICALQLYLKNCIFSCNKIHQCFIRNINFIYTSKYVKRLWKYKKYCETSSLWCHGIPLPEAIQRSTPFTFGLCFELKGNCVRPVAYSVSMQIEWVALSVLKVAELRWRAKFEQGH